MIKWPSFTWRWLAHKPGPCYWTGCPDRYASVLGAMNTPMKHGPPMIPEIDMRRRWVEPTLRDRPWNEAWDDLAEAGKL